MADELLPQPEDESRLSSPRLTPEQVDLCKCLDDWYIEHKLRIIPSELFNGAIFALRIECQNNSDSIAQAANSLREILYPFWSPEVKSVTHKKMRAFKKYHSVLIDEILVNNIGRLYGKLNDLTHHGIECKAFTEDEISDFDENDFKELLDDFVRIMYDALKRQIDIHSEIDRILSKKPMQAISEDAINNSAIKINIYRFKKLLKLNSDTKQYFFAQADERWLDWLWQRGLLDDVKEKPSQADNHAYLMPELNYLARMAEIVPKKIVDIMLSVPILEANFNSQVINQFLRICELLPAAELARIVPKIHDERWVSLIGDFNQLGFPYEGMLQTLSNAHDYKSILILAEEILTVRSKAEMENGNSIAVDNPFYFESLTYLKVFEYLQNVNDEYIEKSFALLIKKLAAIVMLGDNSKKSTTFAKIDKVYLFDADFFTIESDNTTNRSFEEDIHELAATIVILARRLIQDIYKQKQYGDIRCFFNKYIGNFRDENANLPDSQLTWRLRLFIMSLCPQAFKLELKEAFFRIFEAVNIYDVINGSEYEKALQNSFGVLDENDKREYIKLIIENFSDDESDKEKRKWLKNHGSRILSIINKYLKPKEKTVIKKIGFKLDANYKSAPSMEPTEFGLITPRGPITEEELSKLSMADIAKKLRTLWTPEKLREQNNDDNIFNPVNAEGIGKLLRNDIKKRLQDYINSADLFFERGSFDSHYTYSFLLGIQDVIKNDREIAVGINWDGLIKLCLTIKKSDDAKNFDNGGRERESFSGWLAGWDAVHSAMADVIQELLIEKDNILAIKFQEYRNQLLEIISYLLNHPDPTSEEERLETANFKTKFPDDLDYLISDPFTIAINTGRGRAFQAFVFLYIKMVNSLPKIMSQKSLTM